MKKLLMIIPQLSMGGAEHSFYKVYQQLKEYYQIDIVIFNFNDGIAYPVPEDHIISLGVSGGANPFLKIKAFRQRYLRLKRILSEREPDVTLSYLEGANYLNCMMPSVYKRVISQRGSIMHDETMSGVLRILRQRVLIPLLYRRADRIVALNEEIAREIISLTNQSEKTVVIHNMFDREMIEASAMDPGIKFNNAGGRIVICVVGRLAFEKGFHHVLRVLQRLKRMEKGRFVLQVVGYGPDGPQLMSLASQLGLTWKEQDGTSIDLDDDVVFLGSRKNPYPFIQKSDMLIISSSSEGGPNVLLEAMICKTLVISANCPSGPRLRIAPEEHPDYDMRSMCIAENGILIPNFQQPDLNDIYQIWADGIQSVLHDESGMKRMVESAYQYSERFSKQRISHKWREVLEQ